MAGVRHGIAALIMACVVHAALAAEPRPVKLLVILRTTESPHHIHQPYPDTDFRSGAPYHQKWAGLGLPFERAFQKTLDGFDRDPALVAALTRAFRERAPFVEVATSADRARYIRRAPFDSPTGVARAEGYDFVLALYENFVGLAARDFHDHDAGLFTPAFAVSYSLHDLADGRRIARGFVHDTGVRRENLDTALHDPVLFTETWPYLCYVTANSMVDELVRKDGVHTMAVRVGRGADFPAVRDDIEAYRRRLAWRLEPASGWVERRTASSFTRVMFPRGDRALVLQMQIDAELMLPALRPDVRSTQEFVVQYDRQRFTMMPDAPITPFADVTAPGYDAYRYRSPGGEHNLLFVRQSTPAMIQVVTVTLDGDFDGLYQSVRADVEAMLAQSTVTLR
jgi:hypothetical protein